MGEGEHGGTGPAPGVHPEVATSLDASIVDATTHPEPLHPGAVRKAALAIEMALRLLSAVILTALLVLLLWNILLRAANVGGSQVPTEVVELLFTWFVFLGSSILVYRWDHIEVPLVYLFVKGRRMQLASRAVVLLACLLFVVLLVSSSMSLLAAASTRTSPMLHLPQGYWYASVLVGSVLMALAMLLRLIDYAIRFFQAADLDAPGTGTS
jgi:TRAP-type transport system small permease protein